MKKRLQDIVDKIQDLLDTVCGDSSVTRKEYREFLEEVQTGIDASVEAIDEDDRRDARLARGK